MSKNMKFQSGPEIVSVDETKYLIKSGFKQRLKGLKEKPVFLFGHRGIGKTQIMAQVAEELTAELGFEVVVTKRDLSTMESPDFRGLNEVVGEGNDRRTVSRPHISIMPPNDGRGYLIHFDEANRPVDESVYSAMLTLLDEYRIEDQYLSNKMFIVLSGNPAMEDENGNELYHNIKDGDPAFNDRIKRLMLKTDFAETRSYLVNKYPTNELLEAVCEHPDLVCYDGSGMSPRTLEAAIFKYQNVDDRSKLSLELRAILGTELTAHLMNIIKLRKDNRSDASINDFIETEIKNKELLVGLKEKKGRGDYVTRLTQQAHGLINDWMTNDKQIKSDKAAFLMNVLLTVDPDKLLSFFMKLGNASELKNFLHLVSQKADNYRKLNPSVSEDVLNGKGGYYQHLTKALCDFSAIKAESVQKPSAAV